MTTEKATAKAKTGTASVVAAAELVALGEAAALPADETLVPLEDSPQRSLSDLDAPAWPEGTQDEWLSAAGTGAESEAEAVLQGGAPVLQTVAADIWAPFGAGAQSMWQPAMPSGTALGEDSGSAAAAGGNSGPAGGRDENGSGATIVAAGTSGDQRIDGLIQGNKWAGAITYSDPDSTADYQAGYPAAPLNGFAQLTAQQLLTTHFALNSATYTQPANARGFSIEGFTNISITYAGSGSGTGTIRGANSSDPGTAYAYYPSSAVTGGDAFFGNSGTTPTAGNYHWHTVLHEYGHSMGLKHGQDTSGNGAVPGTWDSMEFSIMTYRSYVGGPLTGYTNETWGYAQTYMMLDIAALQFMYGADFTTNSGNTVYKWNPGSGDTLVDGQVAIDAGGNRIFATIWDGNGIDTYDLSSYSTNLNIDLDPGGWSTFDSTQIANLGNGNFARANIFNAMQFNSDARSLIENAIGGSGNDRIDGNIANNVLTGNGGNDTLYGFDGNDTINGGAGNNYNWGADGNDLIIDTFSLLSGNDDTHNGGLGTDTLQHDLNWISTVHFDLAAGRTYLNGVARDTLISIENLIVGGAAQITGSAGGNVLTANGSGANVIDGGAGDDTINAGGGDDTINGGSGVDVMNGGDGNDLFILQNGWTGGPGEQMNGGGGIDTFDFSATTVSTSAVDLQAGTFNYTPGGAGTIALSGIENVIGNAGNDDLRGNGISNVLTGGAGNDTFEGRSGDDTLLGGDGNDLFIFDFGWGSDVIDGGANADTVDFTLITAGFGTIGLDLNTGYSFNGGAVSTTFANIENIDGTQRNDLITGDGGANILNGHDGDDTIEGGGGNDTINGGAGMDRIIFDFGWGTDAIDGGADSDWVDFTLITAGFGTIGLDLNTGYSFNGGAVSTTFANIENVDGTQRNDLITGTAGANILNGNDGDDTIEGGGGVDVMNGGNGNDLFIIQNGWTGGPGEEANGGAGIDTFDISATTVATSVINLAAGLFTYTPGGSGTIALSGIENANGNAGDDYIVGTNAGNLLNGNDGDDLLNGRGGGDTLNGGAGSDTLTYGSSAGAVDVRLYNGFAGGGDATGDVFSGIENLTGSVHADLLAGDGLGNVLNGGNGEDTLVGGNGNDTLNGGGHADLLNGGAGADVLNGGWGGDALIYAGSNAGVDVRLYNGAASGGHATGDTFSGILDLIGSGHADLLAGNNAHNTLTGGGGNDTLSGGNGNDTVEGGWGGDRLVGGGGLDTASYISDNAGVDVRLYNGTASGGHATGDVLFSIENLTGGNGNDLLAGNGGANVLEGGNGNDTLSAGGGQDTLLGGSGNDELRGQGGNDLFIFENNFGQDVITDFSASDAEDIDLSAVGAITDFNDLINNHLNNNGGFAEIFVGANTILLSGVAFGAVGVGLAYSADDFIF